ncbi:ABC transporter transmembrane domain-containing protein [Actinokineospora globicatena]|uniref:ABC transporter permease n=1 Tax=Actinokineospora globicatena TaxID=103729 RepID=A0A9W6V937_9PSEU|nr:ABC transporter ATP-binding protein [Actinokineospora globicatena]GLW90621.1 ABC transporter permease [Actinokineospora globicatena]
MSRTPPTPREVLTGVLRGRAWTITFGALSSSVHQACEAFVPFAIGLAVQNAVDGGQWQDALLAIVGLVALFVVLSVTGGIAFRLLSATTAREAHRLRVEAVSRILADPPVGGPRTAGELTAITTSDAMAAARVAQAGSNIVSGAVGLVATALVLFGVDPLLGVCVVVAVPPLVLGVNAVGPRLEARLRDRREAGGVAAALAADFVRALGPLRAFGGGAEALRRYRRASGRCLETDLVSATADAAIITVGLAGTALITVGIAAAAGMMALSGHIEVGQFVTVLAMAAFVGDPVNRISAGAQRLAAAHASATQIAPLLVTIPEPPAESGCELAGSLRLHGISAGPLRSFTVDIAPGSVVGVVADDSVTAALLGLLSDGRYAYVGEVPLSTVPQHVRRRHVLIAPQEVHLLGRTLAETIDSGRDADQAKVARALTASSAAELPEDLLDGAANLSGGQRQRVALARALVAAPPVLVLRDPLFALDAVTEDHVAERFMALRRKEGSATLVLTTSPQLLSRCDQVVHVAEDGTARTADHARLMDVPEYASVVSR